MRPQIPPTQWHTFFSMTTPIPTRPQLLIVPHHMEQVFKRMSLCEPCLFKSPCLPCLPFPFNWQTLFLWLFHFLLHLHLRFSPWFLIVLDFKFTFLIIWEQNNQLIHRSSRGWKKKFLLASRQRQIREWRVWLKPWEDFPRQIWNK